MIKIELEKNTAETLITIVAIICVSITIISVMSIFASCEKVKIQSQLPENQQINIEESVDSQYP